MANCQRPQTSERWRKHLTHFVGQ